MRVISLNNTKKLVKGQSYEVSKVIRRSHDTHPYINIVINNKSGGRVNLNRLRGKSFQLEDGSPVPNQDWISPEADRKNNILKNTQLTNWGSNEVNVKDGDIVACKTQYLKSVDYGKLYRVEKVIKVIHTGSNGSSWTEIKLKIKGIPHRLSTYHFRKCTQDELREISLNKIFGESDGVITKKTGRKIDQISESDRKKALIHLLMYALYDPHRTTSIKSWAVKMDKRYSITEEDLEEVMDMKISDIIKKYDG